MNTDFGVCVNVGVNVGVVVIGRNEGERLARCLAPVRAIPNQVYVNSGSTNQEACR